MRNWLQTASLPISLVVLTLAAWTYWRAISYERRLIEKFKPSLMAMYADFEIAAPDDPQTLEELLAPMVELFENLSG